MPLAHFTLATSDVPTTAGFIETIRGIVRQAYGVSSDKPFWRYRLGAIGMIVAAVLMVMLAFAFQVILTGIEQFLYRILPWATEAQRFASAGKAVPAGTSIGIVAYALHRDPEHWPDPEHFDPDRFSPARSAGPSRASTCSTK